MRGWPEIPGQTQVRNRRENRKFHLRSRAGVIYALRGIMSTITDKDIEGIVAQYETLVTKRDTLSQNKVKLEAELSARKRALKKVMDETREAGYDPDKIKEELQRAEEVVRLKMEVFKTELEEGENIIRPMLKELREAG